MRTLPLHTNKATQPAGVTVTTSSTHLLADNLGRLGLIITNTGANPVYLALNTVAGTATAGQGIYLGANGGAIQFDGNSLWTGAVDAIAVGGSSVVTTTELIRFEE
jgi:hypothetical protein